MEIRITIEPNRRSPKVSADMAGRIRALYRLGYTQHDIAAMLGINQGRVSEVVRFKVHPTVPPTQGELFQ
ncbi:hypothetical protein ACK6D9_12225 [Hoeflea sp. Naph1]|uniref:hypothetical protein n=1 Tax=Hoeflea sp. Naph1 TaxID=3388653 RepID=UPI00398FFAD7